MSSAWSLDLGHLLEQFDHHHSFSAGNLSTTVRLTDSKILPRTILIPCTAFNATKVTMHLVAFATLALLALPAIASSSSPIVSSTSSPGKTTSGFPSVTFPSNTAASHSYNDVTVSNGVTLTGGGHTNTAKATGGAASSSSSGGAVAPTATSGSMVGAVVGMAVIGAAALL